MSWVEAAALVVVFGPVTVLSALVMWELLRDSREEVLESAREWLERSRLRRKVANRVATRSTSPKFWECLADGPYSHYDCRGFAFDKGNVLVLCGCTCHGRKR